MLGTFADEFVARSRWHQVFPSHIAKDTLLDFTWDWWVIGTINGGVQLHEISRILRKNFQRLLATAKLAFRSDLDFKRVYFVVCFLWFELKLMANRKDCNDELDGGIIWITQPQRKENIAEVLQLRVPRY